MTGLINDKQNRLFANLKESETIRGGLTEAGMVLNANIGGFRFDHCCILLHADIRFRFESGKRDNSQEFTAVVRC